MPKCPSKRCYSDFPYTLISLSSSWRACRSSESPSSLAQEEEEQSERFWKPVPQEFELESRTQRLQRCGWCCLRRDSTAWTLALTEWLLPADWNPTRREGRVRGKRSEQKNVKWFSSCAVATNYKCQQYRSSNKRHISEIQSVVWLHVGHLTWRRFLKRVKTMHGSMFSSNRGINISAIE